MNSFHFQFEINATRRLTLIRDQITYFVCIYKKSVNSLLFIVAFITIRNKPRYILPRLFVKFSGWHHQSRIVIRYVLYAEFAQLKKSSFIHDLQADISRPISLHILRASRLHIFSFGNRFFGSVYYVYII